MWSVSAYFVLIYRENNIYLPVSSYLRALNLSFLKCFHFEGFCLDFLVCLGFSLFCFRELWSSFGCWYGLVWSFVFIFFSWGFFGHGFVRVYFFQIGKKSELEKYSRYEQILLCSVLLSVSTLIIPKMLYLFTFLYSFLKHLPVSREALHLTDGERVQSGMSLWSGTAYYAHSDSENINYY